MIDSWRLRVQQAAEASLDQPMRGLFLGIILGEQHELPARTRDAFMTTGTVHILSISGSHLGLIALLTFVAVRALCRTLPIRWTLGLNDLRLTGTRLAILTTIPIVLIYAFLAGAEVATRRALVMVLAFLFATWSGRDKPLLPILSLTALLMLLVNPHALFDVSFQLSFLSVLAIVLYLSLRSEDPDPDCLSFDTAAGVPLRPFQPSWGRTKQWLAHSLLLSLAITLVTLPLVARYFHQFAWISPFANLIIVPLAGFLVVPIGLASALWLLASGGESLPLNQLNEAVLRLLTETTELWARIPFVDRHVTAPSLLMLFTYYALLALAVRLTVRLPTRLATIGSLTAVLFWWALSPTAALLPGQMRVTFLDVGQGDATVIQMPGGQTTVIDGGGRYGQFDLGASVVGPYLWDQGIHRIDHLIGTHPQLDHVGGVPWLIRHFEVGRYWGNGVTRSEGFYQDLRQALSEKGLTERVPAAGETVAAEAGCSLSIVSPMPSEMMRIGTDRSHRSGSTLNNLSVAARLDCGRAAFLFAADLERPGLARFVQQGLAPHTPVVKVPHHGAASSLELGWIRATAPEIAVVSVGRYNPYHHPHPQVLASYQEQGSRLFRTDQDGAITITGSPRSQNLLIGSASQLKFERVSFADTAWEQERRNYRRVCLRQFGPVCS
jgi:competence protein ComEC